MPYRKLLPALALIAAVSPLSVATAQAPTGTTETRYCMRVEPSTGSRIEAVRCWTREQWAVQGVDLDKDWPEEGVRTIG